MAGVPTAFAVTDFELGSMPFPELPGRLSQRRSKGRTKAVAPRTFENVEEWPGFLNGVETLQSTLDNVVVCNGNPWKVYRNGLKPAASEVGVHGAMDCILFPQVNNLAGKLGCNLSYWCGGSARSLSQTDLVILDDRQPQNMGNLSARVFGNGEAKGPWQWDLGDQSFLDALQNAKCQGACIEVAQQLFGDMVMDESMFGFLTNYNQTVFFRRKLENTKQLWISPVVRINDSPVVNFLYVLQQAEEYCHSKQVFRRELVIETPPGGYSMVPPPLQKFTRSGRASKRPLLPVSVKANPKHGRPRRLVANARTNEKEQTRQLLQSDEPMTREHAGNNEEQLLQSDETMVEDGMHVYEEENFGAIPVYNIHELGITGAVVGIGKFGNVLSGQIGKRKVALKTFDLRNEEAARAIVHEQKVYVKLKSLQGESIPLFFFVGRLPHANVLYLALSNEGTPNAVAMLKGRGREKVEKRIWAALDGFHALGAIHGDLSLGHICLRRGKSKFIDLEYCKLDALEDEIELERAEMQVMLDACEA